LEISIYVLFGFLRAKNRQNKCIFVIGTIRQPNVTWYKCLNCFGVEQQCSRLRKIENPG